MKPLAQDTRILRQLARQVRDIATAPAQAAKRDLWVRHNRLERTRPLVVCLPEISWRELLPASVVRCRDPLFRTVEWALCHWVYRWEHLHDDIVIEPVLRVPPVTRSTGFGLKAPPLHGDTGTSPAAAADFAYNDDLMAFIDMFGEYRRPFHDDATGAYRRSPPLTDPAQIDRLRFPTTEIDEAATSRNLEILRDTVGDIIEVRRSGFTWIDCSLIGTLNKLRGMEQVMLDLYDRPAFIDEMLAFLAESVTRQLDTAERNGWLAFNHRGEHVGSSYGYTDELPHPGSVGTPRVRDLWGHATVQSAPHWSPDMQERFIFPHQRRLLQRFGLAIYGCCEPLRRENLPSLAKIANLRKIIVSPWSDWAAVVEGFGGKCVLAWKPNPVEIAATYDLNRSRHGLERILAAAPDCPLEIILKDVHTVAGAPERLDAFTRMCSELVGAPRAHRNPVD